MAEQPIEVTNNTGAHRYEAKVDGHLSLVDYRLEQGRIVFTHTEVPEALEGRGVGSVLARSALDDARERGLTVVPLCPFIGGYIRRHHEYLPLVDPAYRSKLE